MRTEGRTAGRRRDGTAFAASALYGDRTRLAGSTDRLARQRHHRASRAPGGSRTRLSTLARWCLDRSATGASRTGQQGRKESNSRGAGWSRAARPGAHPRQIVTAPAGLEPATVRLTSVRSTVELQGKSVRRKIHHGTHGKHGSRKPPPPAHLFRDFRAFRGEIPQFRRLGSNQRPSRFQRDALTI